MMWSHSFLGPLYYCFFLFFERNYCLLDTLVTRMSSWSNKFVSLGGMVILLNSVLNSILIFFLSFLKMPNGVWRRIVRIQLRSFLWGGSKGARKIPWIWWLDVCMPKSEGGLGTKDLSFVNLSLSGKWRWRLITGGEIVWKDIIRTRCLKGSSWDHCGRKAVGLRGVSNWWKEISLLETCQFKYSV